MDPYYRDDLVTIYHGDVAEILPGLTKPVDCVVTSPPYNLGHVGGPEWNRLADGYDVHNDDMDPLDYLAEQHAMISRLWLMLSDTGAIWYNHKPRALGNDVTLPLVLKPDHVPLRQVIIWDRGSGFVRDGVHLCPAHEWIMLFTKPAMRLERRDLADVWRIRPTSGKDHPASFPLGIPIRAITSTPGDLVLDPYCGSGTTLLAARDLGRRAIGIDVSERYCEIAAQRLTQQVLAW